MCIQLERMQQPVLRHQDGTMVFSHYLEPSRMELLPVPRDAHIPREPGARGVLSPRMSYDCSTQVGWVFKDEEDEDEDDEESS